MAGQVSIYIDRFKDLIVSDAKNQELLDSLRSSQDINEVKKERENYKKKIISKRFPKTGVMVCYDVATSVLTAVAYKLKDSQGRAIAPRKASPSAHKIQIPH